jgi:hypothetical protein
MVASGVFHVLLLLLALSTLKGAMVTGGGAEGDDAHAITVTLAGYEGGRRSTADSQTEQLKAIVKQLQDSEIHADPKTPSATPRASLDKLLDEIDHEASATDPKDQGSGKGKTDEGGQGASTNSPTAKAADKSAKGAKSLQLGQAGAISSGALWGQVEPCWRRMPGNSAVPVSLEVTLNGGGTIAMPPVILRPKGSLLEERRLIAEARAIASISACVPYRTVGAPGSKQTFRLDFRASK